MRIRVWDIVTEVVIYCLVTWYIIPRYFDRKAGAEVRNSGGSVGEDDMSYTVGSASVTASFEEWIDFGENILTSCRIDAQ